MLPSVVDHTIMRSIPKVVGLPDRGEDVVFLMALDENWAPV